MRKTLRHVIAKWAPERCNVLLYCKHCQTQEATLSANPINIEAKTDRFYQEHKDCIDEELNLPIRFV